MIDFLLITLVLLSIIIIIIGQMRLTKAVNRDTARIKYLEKKYDEWYHKND